MLAFERINPFILAYFLDFLSTCSVMKTVLKYISHFMLFLLWHLKFAVSLWNITFRENSFSWPCAWPCRKDISKICTDCFNDEYDHQKDNAFETELSDRDWSCQTHNSICERWRLMSYLHNEHAFKAALQKVMYQLLTHTSLRDVKCCLVLLKIWPVVAGEKSEKVCKVIKAFR